MSAAEKSRGGLLSTRLFLNLVPLVLMLLAVGVYATVLLSWLATSTSVAAMKHYQSVAAAQAMSLSLARMQGGVLLAFEQQRELGQQLFAQNRKLFEHNLAVQQGNITSPEERAWSAQLATNQQSFVEAGTQIFASPQREEQRQCYEARLYPAMTAATLLLEKISRRHHDAILAAEENARHITRRVTHLLLIGLAAALAIASFACYQVSRSILEPVQNLTRATRELGEGQLGQPVPVAPIRELGELAVAFNKMAAQLHAYRQSTTDEILRLHRTMEATLGSFPDPIFVLNPAGRIELTNPAADSLAAALHLGGALPARLQATARHALQTGENFLPASFQEVVSFRLNGEEKFFLPRIVTMRNAEEALLGIAVVLYDVTRFRLLDDAKTNLVGTVSHELKTPLTSLRLALHLLLEKTTGELSGTQSDLLQTARDDAERMLRTLNNLLDLARLDAGSAELNREETTPDELAAGALREMLEAVSASGLRLVALIDPGLPAVSVDRSRISLVFANLITNASKHSPARGEILLRAARTQSGDVQFSVLDEGPGVPEEYRTRIFDRFFRVPGQTKTGAGLGLSIAREIVVAHGGRIGVKPRDGRGSEFYFTLPRVAAVRQHE
ncbi:MAG: HAMP domain-containing protein [Verrucomicrobia bacterium]|nr:HAMP domain-containing protein [Verrucomicrobiota bacterium]